MGAFWFALAVLGVAVALFVAICVEEAINESTKGDGPSFEDVLAAEAIDAPRIGELIRARERIFV